MAVAGINNVSVLETSYIGENYSPVSRRWGNQERPISRTSYIRKMWRDLEGENKTKETEKQQTSVTTNSNLGSRCSCSSEIAKSEDVSISTSETENECPPDQNQMVINNGEHDNGNLCLDRSAISVADKERVRQVFREWGSKNTNSSGISLNVSHKNNCSRGQRLCENESTGVMTVREWLESNNRHAETVPSPIEEQAPEIGVNHTRVGARRSVRGRQALVDLVTRFVMERKKEMQSLLECRLVSTFAHRNRIQALLRGRFLWNQRFTQDEKSSSTAASELGLLRQTNTVSDLRKGFLSRVDSHEHTHDGSQSDTSSVYGTKDQENHLQNDIVNEFETIDTRSNTRGTHSETETCVSPREYVARLEKRHERVMETERQPPPTESIQIIDQNQNQEGSVERNQSGQPETFDHLIFSETNADILSSQEGSVKAEDSLTTTESIKEDFVEAEEDNCTNTELIEDLETNSVENEDDWYQEIVRSDSIESHNEWYHNHVVARTDAFYASDDENDNRLDLQQLASRRRVSNLLQSDFRVRLEHLIQSYLERHNHAAESDDDEWMLEREQQDLEEQTVDENDDVIDDVERIESAHSSPQTIHQHSGTEWEMINGLRTDMLHLQERMNSMQSTLEACMNMQLQLQRSVQQEVSSALSRVTSSGESNLQSCFLCCDFDSTPNRREHVYVCSNCAEKINWSKVKESVSRHP